MHLTKSTYSYDLLYDAAVTGKFPNLPDTPVRACYVKPDEEVEVFTHVLPDHPANAVFVMAKYAGEEMPIFSRDGSRSYPKRFGNLRNATCNRRVVFASEHYRLRPISAILEVRRDTDSEGLAALGIRIFICDETSRGRFPAYIEEELPALEEPEEQEPPVELVKVLIGVR